MKTITTAAIILVSACATTATTSTPSLRDDRVGTMTSPRIDNVDASPDDARAWFPALISVPGVPSLGRYQRELSTDRDRYDLAVRVCVAPDGSVNEVQLTQPSGSARVDRAVQHDVAAWRYESFRAPSDVRVCKQLAIAYEPVAEYSSVSIPLVRTSQR